VALSFETSLKSETGILTSAQKGWMTSDTDIWGKLVSGDRVGNNRSLYGEELLASAA